MMIKKWKNKIKVHFEDVIKLKTSPRAIALGFAIGSFIAILPTFGLGVFIGLLVILIFKNVSKISLFAAFVVWNPLVLLSLAPVSYKVGVLILGDVKFVTFKIELLNHLYVYSRRFIIGNLIVASVLSLASYFIVYFLMKKVYSNVILRSQNS
jgi:uncharacterized protein